MAKREKITNSSIKALVVEDKRVNDTEIAGFHALISPKGKITYYLYYRLDGKQVNYKLGIHGHITPTQARDLAKAKAGEVANGVDVQESKKLAKRETLKAKHTKLDAFLDISYKDWLETRNAKTASKTIKIIKTAFPELMDRQLSSITAWEIEKWRAEKKKTGMKPATINSYVNPLKGAMSRAVEWGLIESHDLYKVKALKVDNSRIRFLDKNEEARLRKALQVRDKRIKDERENGNKFRQQRNYPLLEELRDRHFADHIQPLVLLAINTGMRKGEMLNLRWESVDLTNKVVTVIAENAKSGKSRHIPLNNEAFLTLRGWLDDTKDHGFVFEGQKGKPITDIKKAWNNLLAEANINGFNFHDLRHHFASRLVMASVDLNTVRELLGHSDLTMTLRYAHLAPEHKASAVNLIG
ncbi:site-specific integrase [Alteromonadaceae bacterium BrNp21-10]|nr:site-specific integrase [Alteromonadaceae bacterium BrNp21-10]